MTQHTRWIVFGARLVGTEARTWPATSEILFPQNVNCVDDEFKPDHRPVSLTILIPDPS